MDVKDETIKKRSIMLLLKLVGGTCWILAYRDAITETQRKGTQLLPEPAIIFNLVWEAIYSAGGLATWRKLTIEDRVQTVLNVAWLVNDVRWAKAIAADRGKLKASTLPAVLAALSYQSVLLKKYPPGEAARISALWQNLAFSSYCALAQGADVDSHRGQRFTVLRAVGTAIPTFTSGALRGVRAKYLVPGLGCVGFDLIRWRRQRAARDLWESRS